MMFWAFVLGVLVGTFIVFVGIVVMMWRAEGLESRQEPDTPGFMKGAMKQMDDISEAYLYEFLEKLHDQGDKRHD